MARVWTVPFKANTASFGSGTGAPGVIPTTNEPCIDLDADTDEYFVLSGKVPDEYAGGALSLLLDACGNTTTAADDARIDVVTEFRTQGAAEALNADNFDGTPDSGTFTFSTTAYSYQRLIIALTPATTPVAGDRFRIKVTRDANHATLDSLAADLKIPSAELYETA